MGEQGQVSSDLCAEIIGFAALCAGEPPVKAVTRPLRIGRRGHRIARFHSQALLLSGTNIILIKGDFAVHGFQAVPGGIQGSICGNDSFPVERLGQRFVGIPTVESISVRCGICGHIHGVDGPGFCQLQRFWSGAYAVHFKGDHERLHGHIQPGAHTPVVDSDALIASLEHIGHVDGYTLRSQGNSFGGFIAVGHSQLASVQRKLFPQLILRFGRLRGHFDGSDGRRALAGRQRKNAQGKQQAQCYFFQHILPHFHNLFL